MLFTRLELSSVKILVYSYENIIYAPIVYIMLLRIMQAAQIVIFPFGMQENK